MLVGMQKRFDGLVLFTIIAGLRPDNIAQLDQLSPFIPKLNLCYDSLRIPQKFFFHIGDEAKNHHAELSSGFDADDMYQQLLDIICGGQDPKPVEEDNNLILNPDNSGMLFMGIPLQFENPDEPPPPPVDENAQPPAEDSQAAPQKMKRSLRMNAISDELYEVDEEEKEKEIEEPPPEPDMPQDNMDDGEKPRDPLNTYVVAFWNPRDRTFADKMKEFLYLADMDRLRQVNADNALILSQTLRDGEEKPVQQKDDELKPYLRLYNCIQGTRQITLNAFERKIPGLSQNSKIILDDDWVFEKVKAMFQAPEEVKLGMFYVFNRQFKQIMETADFELMHTLVM